VRPQLTMLLTLADETLCTARLLIAGGAWGDASSRAYYAAFHAVSAALLSHGGSVLDNKWDRMPGSKGSGKEMPRRQVSLA
jgi:uncharacterized protein (UPF0332 family)